MEIKFPSISDYRAVVKTIQYAQQRLGLGAVQKIKFTGTAKLHGTNAQLIKKEPDSKVLICKKKEVLCLEHDNAGFFLAMSKVNLEPLFDQAVEIYKKIHNTNTVPYPITISGEWAGIGVQKPTVAVSYIPKFLSLFSIRFGDELAANDTKRGYEIFANYKELRDPDNRIFNIFDYGQVEVEVEIDTPQNQQNEIVQHTIQIEENCWCGKYFGIEECTVGEGIVWTPNTGIKEIDDAAMFWFKVKGQKHSVSNVKKLASLNVEQLETFNEFVEYACTENRLQQGLSEIGLDKLKTGDFVGWIIRDIIKEESDTIIENSINVKVANKAIGLKARNWYLKQVNEAPL